MSDKTLTAYRISNTDERAIIVPGDKARTWMDETPNEFAYKCLPLTMANMHGWAVYLTRQVRFVWNGGDGKDDIKVIDSGEDSCMSIFGSGIITFHIMHVIQTPQNYNLWIGGAPNFFKPGIQPLNGLYESDWSPYTFTMNWKITEPNRIFTFNPEVDPICFFFPVPRFLIEEFELIEKPLSSNSNLYEQHEIFRKSRHDFINRTPEEKQIDKSTWQKHYFQGKYPDGSKCPFDHQTKLKVSPLKEQQPETVGEECTCENCGCN